MRAASAQINITRQHESHQQSAELQVMGTEPRLLVQSHTAMQADVEATCHGWATNTDRSQSLSVELYSACHTPATERSWTLESTTCVGSYRLATRRFQETHISNHCLLHQHKALTLHLMCAHCCTVAAQGPARIWGMSASSCIGDYFYRFGETRWSAVCNQGAYRLRDAGGVRRVPRCGWRGHQACRATSC